MEMADRKKKKLHQRKIVQNSNVSQEVQNIINIRNLLTEVLANIFVYLDEVAMQSLASSCSTFGNVLQIEWQKRCQKVLKQKDIKIPNTTSYQELYSKLLYPYGYLLGAWQPDYGCYGGLVEVKLRGNSLVAREYFAPPAPHLERNLTVKNLFSLSYTPGDDTAQFSCHKGYHGPHDGRIKKVDGDEFYTLYHSNALHHHPDGRRDSEIEDFFDLHVDELVDPPQTGYRMRVCLAQLYSKFKTIRKKWCAKLRYNRLHVNFKPSNSVIKPGLFKGCAGLHGQQIVRLEHDAEQNKIIIIKITGDPTIWANHIAISVELSRPVTLNPEQQASVRKLSKMDIPDIAALPSFHAEGQIIQVVLEQDDSLKNRLYPSHWIMFDEDTFGHLWREYYTWNGNYSAFYLSMYRRVTEKTFNFM